MRNLNGALIIGTMCAVLSGNALAGENTFDTVFTYSTEKSMTENYDRFARTAKAACAAEVDRVGRQALSTRARLESNCRDELLTKVVRATRNDILIAYHQKQLKTAQG